MPLSYSDWSSSTASSYINWQTIKQKISNIGDNKEEDVKVSRPWKVYDFWDNIKMSSYGSFLAAAKAAYELRLKHHDEVMPRISHKDFKGFAYVDKNGLIRATHEEEWSPYIGKNGYLPSMSSYNYVDVK